MAITCLSIFILLTIYKIFEINTHHHTRYFETYKLFTTRLHEYTTKISTTIAIADISEIQNLQLTSRHTNELSRHKQSL